MNIAYIKSLLKNYNKNKNIIELRNIEIQAIEKQLEYNNTYELTTKEEAIEEICLSAPGLSDIPKSITNKFSSATENGALHYAEIINTKNIYDAIELKTRKRILEEQNIPLQHEIDLVETLIKRLKVKEQFIINKHYIDGYKFAEMEQQFYKVFGVQSIHQNTVYNQYQSALSNMLNRYLEAKK